MTKYFETPFANAGDKTVIPDDSQPSGSVSFTDGYTPDYEGDQEIDPDAKDVPRQSENYLKFVITEALKEIQEIGGKVYDPLVNYSVGAIIPGSDGNQYKCRIKNGPDASFLPVVNPVGDTTGTWGSNFIANTQTYDPVRPKGQFAFKSNESDSTSHAILTGHILNALDEGALEFVVKYDDTSISQICADFVRTIGNGAGPGDKVTARVVRAIHIASGPWGDTVPFAAWDGGSCCVCLGETSLEPYREIPPVPHSFYIGSPTGVQCQVFPIKSATELLMQVYDNDSTSFHPMDIRASKFIFGQGSIEPDVDDTRLLGTSDKRFNRIWVNDVQAETLSLGVAVTYLTGVGSPEGVVPANTGSMYTNQSGGAGTTLYVKESSPTTTTGWVAK